MKLLNQLTKIYIEKYDAAKFKEPEFRWLYAILCMQHGAGNIKSVSDVKKLIELHCIQTDLKKRNLILFQLMQLLEDRSFNLKLIIEDTGGMIEDTSSFIPSSKQIGVVVD